MVACVLLVEELFKRSEVELPMLKSGRSALALSTAFRLIGKFCHWPISLSDRTARMRCGIKFTDTVLLFWMLLSAWLVSEKLNEVASKLASIK